jgi:cation diffusion facilitator CzcD-associated flavoprotein CzcO
LAELSNQPILSISRKRKNVSVTQSSTVNIVRVSFTVPTRLSVWYVDKVSRERLIADTHSKFIKGEYNRETVAAASAQMAEKLNHDPVLCEKLIPKWEIGCRRVTPGPGYLESFSQPNCSLTNSRIIGVTETGVKTEDGQEFECDVSKLKNACFA